MNGIDSDERAINRLRTFGQRWASPQSRLAACGTVRTRDVEVTRVGDRVSIPALSTCLRTWECAHCATRQQGQRRAWLVDTIEAWMAAGGIVLMATLTIGHRREHSLELVLNVLRRARRKLLYGSARGRLLGRYGIEAVDWTLEVQPPGDNGWHPHYHVLLFVKAGMDKDPQEEFQRALSARWANVLASEGATSAALGKHGVHVRVVDDAGRAARYLTKMPLADRADDTDGGFRILREFAEQHQKSGCEAACTCARCSRFLGLWREYAETMRNVHRFDPPTGWKRRSAPVATAPESPGRAGAATVWLYEPAWALTVSHGAVSALTAAVRAADAAGARGVIAGLLEREGFRPLWSRVVAWAWVNDGARRRVLWTVLRGVARARTGSYRPVGRVAARPGPGGRSGPG